MDAIQRQVTAEFEIQSHQRQLTKVSSSGRENSAGLKTQAPELAADKKEREREEKRSQRPKSWSYGIMNEIELYSSRERQGEPRL